MSFSCPFLRLLPRLSALTPAYSRLRPLMLMHKYRRENDKSPIAQSRCNHSLELSAFNGVQIDKGDFDYDMQSVSWRTRNVAFYFLHPQLFLLDTQRSSMSFSIVSAL